MKKITYLLFIIFLNISLYSQDSLINNNVENLNNNIQNNSKAEEILKKDSQTNTIIYQDDELSLTKKYFRLKQIDYENILTIPDSILFIKIQNEVKKQIDTQYLKQYYLNTIYSQTKIEQIIINNNLIIKKKNINNNLFIYDILVLLLVAFILFVIFKRYLIKIYKKIKKPYKLFYNEGYNNINSIRLESYIFFIFYAINISYILILLINKILPNLIGNDNNLNQYIYILFLLVCILNFIKYFFIKFIFSFNNLIIFTIIYKVNMMYKEINSFLYLFLNIIIILTYEYLDKNNAFLILLTIFIIYGIKKTILFINANKIKKNYSFLTFLLLFLSEYFFVILSYIIYIYI